MKNLIVFLFIVLKSLTFYGSDNPKKVITLDQEKLVELSVQLDLLHDQNNNDTKNDDWFIALIGYNTSQIKSVLSEINYEYLSINSFLGSSFDEKKLKAINENLKQINANNDYDMYAFMADSDLKIVIPSGIGFKSDSSKFRDELEKRLITASFETKEEIDKYKQQNSLERKIRSQIAKGKSKNLINAIFDKVYQSTTLFKNSDKKYHILTFNIFSHLYWGKYNGKGFEGGSEIYYKSINAHGTKFPKGKPSQYNIASINDFLRTKITGGYDQRMLARIEAIKSILIDERETIASLNEGVGKRVYLSQKDLVLNDDEDKKLIELANFLTEAYSKQTITEKYEVIVDYDSKVSGKDRDNLLALISENGIKNKEEFLNIFPYYGVARQYFDGNNEFRVFFSNTNLWTKNSNLSNNQNLDESYNKNSVDYYLNSIGFSNAKYYYSLEDLVTRYKYIAEGDTSTVLTKEILRVEDLGEAQAVNQSEGYRQYVALFGTDSAVFFMSFWAAKYAKEILPAYFLRQIVAEYGVQIIAEVTREKAIELAVAVNVEILMQTFLNFYFVESTQFDLSSSVRSINKKDVLYSATKTLLSLSLKQEMIVDCAKGALLDSDYNINESFNIGGCAESLVVGFMERYISNHGVGFFKSLRNIIKNRPEAFEKGFKRLIQDIGEDQAKIVAKNFDEIFKELGVAKPKALEDFINSKLHNTNSSSSITNNTDTNSDTNTNENTNSDTNTNTDNSSDGNTNTDTETNSTDSSTSNITSTGRKVDAKGSLKNNFDGVNTNAVKSLEVEAEIVATNNSITDEAKKFWQNHEMNVTDYLRKTYGSTKLGRQITVDIKIKGIDKPVRCRLDNLVDTGGGKFKIIDAKSSIKVDLSKVKLDELKTAKSTHNQKKFYKALEEGTVEKITPKGKNAQDFFGENLRENISIENSVDFYVNDISKDGYNIFKILFEY